MIFTYFEFTVLQRFLLHFICAGPETATLLGLWDAQPGEPHRNFHGFLSATRFRRHLPAGLLVAGSGSNDVGRSFDLIFEPSPQECAQCGLRAANGQYIRELQEVLLTLNEGCCYDTRNLRAGKAVGNTETSALNGVHYRFADFEGDFRTFELRKHGLKVKLQEQPLRILQALLERPGELFTREELRARLWPKDLYVDCERNLTTAMNKLRAALNDSAESPRYIETLPRRGYRFIASVEEIQPDLSPSSPLREPAPVRFTAQPGLLIPATHTPVEARRELKWNRLALAIGVPALLVASVVLLVLRANRLSIGEPTSPAIGPVRLAVLPFVNLTGDERREYLCDGLTEEMIAELSRMSTGRLDVIARTSAMQYKKTSKAIPEIGRELRVGYVLESSVREFGDRVRVTTQLVRASDASHVWTGQYDRDLKDVLQLQQEVAAAIAEEIKVNLSPQATARRATLTK